MIPVALKNISHRFIIAVRLHVLASFLLRLLTGYTLVFDYQKYLVSKTKIIPLAGTRRKWLPLTNSFPATIQGRSFLDIGCNCGFFCFWARILGASSIIGLDLSRSNIALCRETAATLGLSNVDFRNQNFVEIEGASFDVTLCLSVIHHLFTFTTDYGNFDDILGKLARLTKHCLIIEFVPTEDPSGKKLVFAKVEKLKQEYNLENFLSSLSKFFPHIESLGQTAGIRSLYMAFKDIK